MARVKGKIVGVGTNSRICPTCEIPSYKILRQYDMWRAMLVRSTDEKFKESNISYVDSRVNSAWLDYPNFYDWYENYTYKERNWQLDKDILFKGNKEYGPDTCCLVPREINSLLISRKNDRGDYPIGVSLHKMTSRFSSTCSDINGNRRHLGLFDSPEAAFYAFKAFKENVIKQMADKYSDKLREDVYCALMQYKVEIGD